VEHVAELVAKAAEIDGVSDRVGASIPANYGPPRPDDVRDSQADTIAASKELGHAPRFTFEQGLLWSGTGLIVWREPSASSHLTTAIIASIYLGSIY
jgi:nucleoside-diphosphate-sugar epimerase